MNNTVLKPFSIMNAIPICKHISFHESLIITNVLVTIFQYTVREYDRKIIGIKT